MNIQYNGPATVDENMVLNQLVQQPCDQSPSLNKDTYKLTEKWKGPYNVLKDMLLTNFYYGNLRENAIPSNALSRFNPPNPGTNKSWIIESADLSELESGSHAIITITYTAVPDTQIFNTWTQDTNNDTWNLSWASYNVTPYAFLKNDEVYDPYVGTETDYTDTAYRPNIEKFFNSKQGDKSQFVYFNEDSGHTFMLNGAEQLAVKKVLQNVNAQYHYPIVTHTTVYNKNVRLSAYSDVVNYFDDIVGKDIDYIKTDEGFSTGNIGPFQFPNREEVGKNNSWEFIKVGDNMTYNKVRQQDRYVLTWTRQEIFWGARSWDKNFYGNTSISGDNRANLPEARWFIGEL